MKPSQTLQKLIKLMNRTKKRCTEHVLSSGCPDDDLCSHRRNPNLDAGVTVLCKLPGEDLVQLSEENAIGDELKKYKTKNMKSKGSIRSGDLEIEKRE